MKESKTPESKGKKRIIADAILVCSLLAVSLSVFLNIIFNGLYLTRRDGAYARVTVDGDEVARYSLSDDGEYPLNGGTNLLVISGGQAHVEYASCPDGLCINQGEISMSGERIVCLPNRVMVEIVGSDSREGAR